MKIKYIKEHSGQGGKVGTETEVPDYIGKHLIRFGYAEESGLQQLAEATKEVSANDGLENGSDKPKGNVRGGQAGA